MRFFSDYTEVKKMYQVAFGYLDDGDLLRLPIKQTEDGKYDLSTELVHSDDDQLESLVRVLQEKGCLGEVVKEYFARIDGQTPQVGVPMNGLES